MPKYGSPVTDPKLLAQLEGSDDKGLSDDDLAKLEEEEKAKSMQIGMSNFTIPSGEEWRDILKNAVSGFGKGAQQVASTLTGGYAPQVNYDEILDIKKQNPTAQTVGKYMPAVASGGSSMLGQAAAGGIYGGLSAAPGEKPEIMGLKKILPENRIGVGMQDAILPLVLGALGRTVNYGRNLINPDRLANQLAQRELHGMQHTFTDMSNRQTDAYDAFNRQFGHTILTQNPQQYLHYPQEILQEFGPRVRNLYRNFLNDPIASRLHRFQSQLGKESMKMRGNSLLNDKRQAYDEARSIAQGNMSQSLQSNPAALASYEHGRAITRDELEPMRVTKDLRKVMNRKKNDLSLDELENVLTKASEQGENVLNRAGQTTRQIGGIPEGHYLQTALNRIRSHQMDVERLRNQSELAKYLTKGLAKIGLGSAIAGATFEGGRRAYNSL
jgi:hypothetical protein